MERYDLKNDLLWLAGGTVFIGILLKILFPLSETLSIVKLIGAIAWLFIIPGYCITLPWKKELELKERIVIGMLAAAGSLAIVSYYLGLLGLHIRWHSTLLPLAAIGLGIYFSRSKKLIN